MKKIVFLLCVVSLFSCKKDDAPKGYSMEELEQQYNNAYNALLDKDKILFKMKGEASKKYGFIGQVDSVVVERWVETEPRKVVQRERYKFDAEGRVKAYLKVDEFNSDLVKLVNTFSIDGKRVDKIFKREPPITLTQTFEYAQDGNFNWVQDDSNINGVVKKEKVFYFRFDKSNIIERKNWLTYNSDNTKKSNDTVFERNGRVNRTYEVSLGVLNDTVAMTRSIFNYNSNGVLLGIVKEDVLENWVEPTVASSIRMNNLLNIRPKNDGFPGTETGREELSGFDLKGNWTTKKTYEKGPSDNEPVHNLTITRTFTYYP